MPFVAGGKPRDLRVVAMRVSAGHVAATRPAATYVIPPRGVEIRPAGTRAAAAPPATSQSIASEAWWAHAFVRPAAFTGCLAVATLFAAVKTVSPIARPVSFEPPQQVVNTTSKGSKLETQVAALEIDAPVVAAAEPDPDPVLMQEGEAERDAPRFKGKPMVGLASFYWQGKKTASGEKFDPQELTAAHRTLPFGTRVRVTSLATGRSVTVRINDRGPFVDGRIVDISRGAAQSLGMVDRGVTKVKLDVIQ
jgi:peptidoglycan lytic transglycosylase